MVNIRIKDTLFEIVPGLKTIGDLKSQIGSTYKNYAWNIESKVKHFKFILNNNIVKDKPSFKRFYLSLLDKHKDKKSYISKKYPFLFPFQIDTIHKIHNCEYTGFLCGYQMGLGKTLTSLCAMLMKSPHLLIICPAPLKYQWRDEIIKFIPEHKNDIIIFEGSKAKRSKLYKENSKSIKIISYDTFKNDVKLPEFVKCIRLHNVICDESTKLKNKKSARYKSFAKLKQSFKFKLFLSGTPVSKALNDIHTIISLIDRYIISNYYNTYLIMEEQIIGWGHNTKRFMKLTGYKNLDMYVTKIKPVYDRKTQTDIGKQLPDKVIKTITIDHDSKYHKIKNNILKILTPFTGFSLLQMLDSDIANIQASESDSVELLNEMGTDYSKIKKNTKMEVLLELVEEINQPCLIFSKYLKSCEQIKFNIKTKFKDKKVVIVTAHTKNKNDIKNQLDEGKIDIVIATDTWSEGISLPNVNYLINYSIPVMADKYLQKIDRICRINSTQTKFIYNLCGDIIETHIMNLLQQKLLLMEQITEGKAGIVKDIDIKKEVCKILDNK